MLKSWQVPPGGPREPFVTCEQEPVDPGLPEPRPICFHSNSFPEHYGANDSCVIQVPALQLVPGAVMVTEAFHTEAGSDILRINGFEFSGVTLPEPVEIPLGVDLNFTWTIDGSGTHSGPGWRVCFSPLGDDPPTPSGPREPFVSCEQEPVDRGLPETTPVCFHSNNFPEHYGANESCVIQVPAVFSPPGGWVMSTQNFSTQANVDFLRINGQGFSGTSLPDTRLFAVGEYVDFSWASDGSIGATGWRICFAPGDMEPTLEPTAPPLPTAPPGLPRCEQEPEGSATCFHSNNFPEQYGDSESCIIQFPGRFIPLEGLVMSTQNFNTEADYDFLSINEDEFSGTSGPPTMEFAADRDVNVRWESDGSITATGWRICFAPRGMEPNHTTAVGGPDPTPAGPLVGGPDPIPAGPSVGGLSFGGPQRVSAIQNKQDQISAHLHKRSLVEKEGVARKVSSQHHKATFWKTWVQTEGWPGRLPSSS